MCALSFLVIVIDPLRRKINDPFVPMESRKNLFLPSLTGNSGSEVIVVPGPGTNHPLHGYAKEQTLEMEWPGRKRELQACTVVVGFARILCGRDR